MSGWGSKGPDNTPGRRVSFNWNTGHHRWASGAALCARSGRSHPIDALGFFTSQGLGIAANTEFSEHAHAAMNEHEPMLALQRA
jgi:hypothetical protein